MTKAAIRNRSTTLAALFHPAILFFFLLTVAVRAFAGSATLAWDPVSSPALSGYMLYYGPAAGNYTSKIDVGNTTQSTVANLTDGGTYHFAATAYDSSHIESAFSNDVTTTVPVGAPVAGFTASATSGFAPLAMNFTNTSTGSITGYAWNFGDGTSSTVQSPSHVYSAAGVYTVSLTVTGSGGSNTDTMPNYMTVTSASDTSPPTAPSTLAAGASGSSSINLTWQGSTDNVGVTGYRIERCQSAGCTTFAQIATSTTTGFADTGLAAGTSYSYRVRATDAAGNLSAYSNSATTTTTTVAIAPVAAFSGSPTSGVAPLTVNFSSASTGTVTTYAWNFGDGTTSAAQNPSPVYAAAGSYNVSLTVTGSAGSSTKSSAGYVTVAAPPAPVLAGNLVLSSAVANLTNIGSSDWVQWPGNVQKSTGGGKIGGLVLIGSASSNAYTGDARTVQWSDGTPTASGSNNAGVAMSGTGSGYQFTAPADTTARTLTIYVGVRSATGTLTAHLSDGSVADYAMSYSARTQRSDGVYTLTYRAASAGQTVTVKWTQSKGIKSSSNVSLQAAALQ